MNVSSAARPCTRLHPRAGAAEPVEGLHACFGFGAVRPGTASVYPSGERGEEDADGTGGHDHRRGDRVPSMNVVDAAKKMIEQKKGPLPIVEGDRVLGMVTDRDLVAKVVAAGRDPNECSVTDVGTMEPVTIEPDQDLDEARRLMAQHQLDRLIVVDGGRLAGIVSEADIRRDEGPLA
jgi:CBS domain